MKRRHFLGSVALGSLAATAGCINLAGNSGDDGDGTRTGPATVGAPNFDLPLCSETEDEVYQVTNPRLEQQPDQNRVAIKFTLDYVGPNQDAFSVTPTINVLLFDDSGQEIGTLNKAETFSPDSTKNLEYFYSDDGWGEVAGFGFEILHQQSDEESGCLNEGSGGTDTEA